MAQPLPPPATACSEASPPRAASAARLVRRRREWLWTGFLSLYGSVVYGILTASYLGRYGTAALDTVMRMAIVPFLLIAALLGLSVAAVDTALLRRAGEEAQAAGRAAAGHWLLTGQRSSCNPGPRPGWCWQGWLVLLALAVPAVLYLPHELSAVSYLAGMGTQGAPSSTRGWTGPAAPGLSLAARSLAWLTGSNTALAPRFSDAVGVCDISLVFDGLAGAAAAVIHAQARRRLRMWRAGGEVSCLPPSRVIT